MRLKNLRSNEIARSSSGCTTRISCEIEGEEFSSEFWYQIEADDLVPAETFDPFVLPALLRCMKTGEDLEIEGDASRRLAMAIRTGLQDILLRQIAGMHKVALHAHLVNRPPATSEGAIVGVSLGVDSLTVMERFLHSDVDEASRIRCLLFNDVGSHGQVETSAVHARRKMEAAEYADEIGVQIVSLRSNMNDLIPWSFEETHTIRNFSAALVLQGSFDKFYYASGYHFADMKLGPYQDIAYADGFLLPLLSTEALAAYVVGADMTRVEKTRLIAENEIARKRLDVCVTPHLAHGFKNCSNCQKCLRTMITLEMFGKLDAFSSVFDLEAYERRKRTYLVQHLYSETNSFHKDIIEHAISNDYRFNLSRAEHSVLKMRAALRRQYWRARLAIPAPIKAPLRRLWDRLRSFVAPRHEK